jgi:hypothetical protein
MKKSGMTRPKYKAMALRKGDRNMNKGKTQKNYCKVEEKRKSSRCSRKRNQPIPDETMNRIHGQKS